MRDWLIKWLGGTPPLTEEAQKAAIDHDLRKIVRKVERMIKSFPHLSTEQIADAITQAIVKE